MDKRRDWKARREGTLIERGAFATYEFSKTNDAGWTPVPQFGGWDQKGTDDTNYSVVFSRARANRKQNKAGFRHSSLGSEQELMASSRYHHHQLHFPHETQDDDSVLKKKRILTYINCCIRPN